jgi:hypothetical protein
VFTARYALSPYIKQIRFVFIGLICHLVVRAKDPYTADRQSYFGRLIMDMTLYGQAGLLGLFPLGQIPQVFSRKGLFPESEARKGLGETPTSKRYMRVIGREAGSRSEGRVWC